MIIDDLTNETPESIHELKEQWRSAFYRQKCLVVDEYLPPDEGQKLTESSTQALAQWEDLSVWEIQALLSGLDALSQRVGAPGFSYISLTIS